MCSTKDPQEVEAIRELIRHRQATATTKAMVVRVASGGRVTRLASRTLEGAGIEVSTGESDRESGDSPLAATTAPPTKKKKPNVKAAAPTITPPVPVPGPSIADTLRATMESKRRQEEEELALFEKDLVTWPASMIREGISALDPRIDQKKVGANTSVLICGRP